VTYFQQQNGLAETGVVDDATWQALEGSGGQTGGAGGAGTGQQNPVDLRVPFVLQMRWDQITLEDLNKGWNGFDLAQVPDLKLEYKSPVGKLIGNGGVQLLNGELKLWDSWFLDWSTKLVFDFAKDKGIQIGTDNHVDLGIRPTKNLTLKLEGDMNFKWAPLEAKGDMYLYGGLKLELKFDVMGGK
jgi:peptidoglycan hydrolase-like protein with peptidoglycan-binding domain